MDGPLACNPAALRPSHLAAHGGASSSQGTRNVMRLLQKLVSGIVLLCSVFTVAAHTDADYPNRPIRWIVSYPPGGTTDLLARLMGQYLSQRLGQQVIVDNRAGGGNNIGTEMAVQGAAGRLHDLPRESGECDQCDAVSQAAVRVPQRHGADRRPHPGAERHDGDQELPREERRRVHRLRQEESRTRSTWPRRARAPRCTSRANSSST